VVGCAGCLVDGEGFYVFEESCFAGVVEAEEEEGVFFASLSIW